MTCGTESLEDVGQKHGSFVLKKRVEVQGLQCVLRELEHEETKAQVVHIANDDPENVFCLSFRTLPQTSNGVAHILEHTVLCGSKKYPVKDPFFSMNRRSLNTFMNALTGSDFTCYPAASQVKKDLYNLLDVYLDAVFQPNLHELSFLQEGHRLEWVENSDGKAALEFKGVVFNEMKGAWASPEARLGKVIRENIFSNITYAIDSGGDPKEIPSLTYEQLLDFHRTFYHPSRCVFYFYGNMPLGEFLDFIEEKTLRGVEKAPPIPSLPLQKRNSKPQLVVENYPASPNTSEADQSYVAFAWLTCHILNQKDLIGLAVLDLILTGTDASPLKYALLQSGLCKQAEAYLEEDISEVPFVLVLKACSCDDADKLQEVVFNALNKVLEEGISQERVEAAIHQIELYRKEITGDSYPFGLSLFMRSVLLKQHGGNTEDGLSVHKLFEDLNESTKDPQYLLDLLKRYLVDNPHFTRVVLKPDSDLLAKELEEEKSKLEQIKKELSESEGLTIQKQAQDLEELQELEEVEELEMLPKVLLEDVPYESKNFSLTKEALGDVELYHHDCFANGLFYADVVYRLPALAKEDLSLLKMFTSLLPNVGCGGRDYKKNLEYIQEHTGGVGMVLSLNSQAHDAKSFLPTLSIGGKALHRKAQPFFSLICEMLQTADFTDVSRLKELLVKQFANLESSLNRQALRYATHLANASFSVSSNIINRWSGLEYFWFLKDLVENFDQRIPSFVDKMLFFQKHFLSLKGAHLVVGAEKKIMEDLKRESFYGLLELQGNDFQAWEIPQHVEKVSSQGRVISSPVAFTTMAMPGLHYTHSDSQFLSLAALILDNKTLHKRVREQGGAYGSGAVNGMMSGSFYFYSYRDPNLAATLQAFEESVQQLAEGSFNEEDILEAKFGIIQGLDTPISPGSRAMTAYAWLKEGKDLQARQTYRERMLSATKEQVCQAVHKHLVPNLDSSVLVSFSERAFFEKENEKLLQLGREPLKIMEVV